MMILAGAEDERWSRRHQDQREDRGQSLCAEGQGEGWPRVSDSVGNTVYFSRAQRVEAFIINMEYGIALLQFHMVYSV